MAWAAPIEVADKGKPEVEAANRTTTQRVLADGKATSMTERTINKPANPGKAL
jgi:hypothetical protein